MSQEPVGSKAPYLIICSGRTGVQATNDPKMKVCAASYCAAALVEHLAVVHGDELKFEDTKAISDLQHEMMDGMLKYSKAKAEAKCKEMFGLLYQLEDKFE